ncbi:TPA: carboxylate--amine ligase [Streptococcus suis]
MKILLNKYTPTTSKLEYISDNDVIVIAPLVMKKKYEKYINKGKKLPQIIYLDDYTLPNFISTIRNEINHDKIDNIITLDEDYMWIAGFLSDYFMKKNSYFVTNSLFQDKYLMRSILFGIVPQPQFRLIETYDDIDIFWKNTKQDQVVIKPRIGAACQGIIKCSRGDMIPKEYINSQYLIEEYVNLSKMLTCDGYSVGNKIQRIFSHEYEELLLGTIGTSNEFTVRTNKLYSTHFNFLKTVFEACGTVLNEFVDDEAIVPFHFEWFFDELTEEYVFCEVGKRFGGGDIPNLIQKSFDVDVIKEFWNDMFSINKTETKSNLKDIMPLPHFISATYSPYRKQGKLISVPENEKFSWVDEIYIFSKIGLEAEKVSTIIEADFIAIIVCKSEQELTQKLDKLRMLAQEFVWE